MASEYLKLFLGLPSPFLRGGLSRGAVKLAVKLMQGCIFVLRLSGASGLVFQLVLTLVG